MLRDFKAPDDVPADEIDANGDGEVLVVLNLQVDRGLVTAGVAREVVNRCDNGSGWSGAQALTRCTSYPRFEKQLIKHAPTSPSR